MIMHGSLPVYLFQMCNETNRPADAVPECWLAHWSGRAMHIT